MASNFDDNMRDTNHIVLNEVARRSTSGQTSMASNFDDNMQDYAA